MSQHTEKLRKQLIAAINKQLEDAGLLKDVVVELDMTQQNLRNHLNINGHYKKNVEKLKWILEKVTAMAETNRKAQTEDVQVLLEKAN